MNAAIPAPVEPVIPGARMAARRDLALVGLLSITAGILCARFNVSEAMLSWMQPRERFQLDELPSVLLVFAASLIWFSIRRYREACQEIERRRRAEITLSAAVADNRRLAQQNLANLESERRTLARDLHDELGQYLNAIRIDATAMREHFPPSEPGHRAAVEMIGNIDRVQGVVMGLIRELRPVGLDDLGLAAALEHCLNQWGRRLPQLTIERSITDVVDELDEMRRMALFRVVQEALTNVARHSRATRLRIHIEREQAESESSAWIVASIEDNGIGADPTRPVSGLGLIGMHERMEAIGGSLLQSSAPGGGFALSVRIPLVVMP